MPAAFRMPVMRDYMGYRPTQRELAAADAAVADLERFADYSAIFGIHAPPPGQLAEAIKVARQWRALRNREEAFAAYLMARDAVAWKDALVLVESLRPIFEVALMKDPPLEHAYPGLTELFGASKVVGKLASATKKRKKKAAQEAAEAEAASSEASSVGAPEETPAASPAKTITVKI